MHLPIKKFKIKSNTMWLLFLLTIICLIGYIVCTYYINISDFDTTKVTKAKDLSILQTLKDILLVFVSICGANLILSLIVEVKTKNALITDILLNDVIAAPDFYEKMEQDKKEAMFAALEGNLYFNHSMNHLLFKSIRKKINEMACDYYYESCNYMVTCNINDTYIEKEITKTVKIKSYDDKYTIREFSVGNCSSKKIEGLDPFSLVSLVIDGKEIDITREVEPRKRKIGKLDERNKYDFCREYIYKKALKLTKDKETTITVICKTRTAIDDKSSIFRVVKPCKKFSLMFTVKQHEKYRLAVDAFGFLDDADDSANSTSSSDVNITFNDWIFKYDGVVVVILDKK